MCLIARSDPNNNTIVKRKKCHQDPLYALYLVLDLPLFRTRIWTVRSKVFKNICHFVLSAHGFFLFTCDTFTHCLIRLDKKRPAFLQESRRDQEEGGELDCQESPGEIKSREVELGSEIWTSFASVVAQQQCYGHCLVTLSLPINETLKWLTSLPILMQESF